MAEEVEKAGKRAIAIAGMPGSGKGTLCELAKEAGFSVISFGDIAREVTRREAGKFENAHAVGSLADKLRREIGPDWIAQEAAKKAETIEGDICFDDTRTGEEVLFLRKKYPALVLVGISVDDDERYRRIFERKRPDDLGTLEEIRKKDGLGGAWGIRELLKSAQVTIPNNSTIEEFSAKARRRLSDIKSNWGKTQA